VNVIVIENVEKRVRVRRKDMIVIENVFVSGEKT
jgi:hypothetical protein